MVTLPVFCARKSSLRDTGEALLLFPVVRAFLCSQAQFWLDTKSGPSLLGWGLQRDASLRAPASNQATRAAEHTSGLQEIAVKCQIALTNRG